MGKMRREGAIASIKHKVTVYFHFIRFVSIVAYKDRQRSRRQSTRACVPTVAPLVAQGFTTTRPYFFMGNAEGTETRNSVFSLLKNKGASGKTLRLLRAQPLVRRRVSVRSIPFVIFCNIVFAQKRIK
jgi:hypothetical protein